MNVLAINSSESTLSAALNLDGETRSRQKISDRNHNLFVLVMIDDLLSDAGISMQQLDGIAFGEGPGSFTGLRISAGVAQGIAFGADIPALPVSCLAAIAQKQCQKKVVAAIDAKRSQVYWACYVRNSSAVMNLQDKEQLTRVSGLKLQSSGWYGAGSGWDSNADRFYRQNENLIADWAAQQKPHAEEIALIGRNLLQSDQGRPAYLAIPNYMSPYSSH